jgi:hypothetical protein
MFLLATQRMVQQAASDSGQQTQNRPEACDVVGGYHVPPNKCRESSCSAGWQLQARARALEDIVMPPRPIGSAEDDH